MRPSPAQAALLSGDAWFGGIEAGRRDRLVAASTVVAKADGARIYATGDAPNGLWGVIEGRIRLLDYPRAGAEVLIRSLAPGEWFGEISIIDGGPRPQDAVAAGPTVLAHLSPGALASLATTTPEIYRDLARLACVHQRAALAFIGQRVALPIRARVATALLQAAPDAAEAGLAVRQAELAVIVGVSRQTLNRTLKTLEREGAIRLGYARIDILDPARLAAARSAVWPDD